MHLHGPLRKSPTYLQVSRHLQNRCLSILELLLQMASQNFLCTVMVKDLNWVEASLTPNSSFGSMSLVVACHIVYCSPFLCRFLLASQTWKHLLLHFLVRLVSLILIRGPQIYMFFIIIIIGIKLFMLKCQIQQR